MSEVVLPGARGPWPVLEEEERRILGVLVEKAKTTPDAYPLSINALVTGCNQKSNRDPLMSLEEDDVEDALGRLKNRGLVMKVIGGRVERWRHLLYETWHVDKIELAILAELLLRGPQTEGELRTRASRMEPIDDLDALREKLRPLVDRTLVVYLTPEERRGAVLTHGFHDKTERQRLTAQHASVISAPERPAPSHAPVPSHAPAVVQAAPPRSDERVAALAAALETLRGELLGTRQELSSAQQRIAALEKTAAELRATLATTLQELVGLKQALGG
jgi:uncharacterized protein YceH (UPF0502 family)